MTAAPSYRSTAEPKRAPGPASDRVQIEKWFQVYQETDEIGHKYLSQSHRTDQGSSKGDEITCTLQADDASQSHRTDQDSSKKGSGPTGRENPAQG